MQAAFAALARLKPRTQIMKVLYNFIATSLNVQGGSAAASAVRSRRASDWEPRKVGGIRLVDSHCSPLAVIKANVLSAAVISEAIEKCQRDNR